MPKEKRIRVFKRTNDNWYPSYQIQNDCRVKNLVEVSFIQLDDVTFRCCVWGADDFGMEKDDTNESIIWNLFLQVISWETVDKSKLEEFGFTWA